MAERGGCWIAAVARCVAGSALAAGLGGGWLGSGGLGEGLDGGQLGGWNLAHDGGGHALPERGPVCAVPSSRAHDEPRQQDSDTWLACVHAY
jgi:hypothetical protein